LAKANLTIDPIKVSDALGGMKATELPKTRVTTMVSNSADATSYGPNGSTYQGVDKTVISSKEVEQQ
jgi:hypothetical protein